jgi:hypothetical protein
MPPADDQRLPMKQPLDRVRWLRGLWQRCYLWFLRKRAFGEIDGVCVSDFSAAFQPPKEFFDLIKESMDLIRSVDSRRYRRICSHLAFIVNTELISAATYDDNLRVCSLDYNKQFTSGDKTRDLHFCAMTLIHEATHALLFRKNIPYDEHTRERIERLCHTEEIRFGRKISAELESLSAYNAEYLDWYWTVDPKTRRAALWGRIREAYATGKSPSPR